MIIDFHTHVFPDKIASRTIELLAVKGSIPAFSDGRISSLVEEMKKAGTDVSINLPVLTSPSQFDSINRFAKEINSAFLDKSHRLISFAGIHPACSDIEGKMAFIRESGFLGVKIHPDYQGTYIDDEGYVKILKCAKENDLIVVTHAGVDCGFRDMPVRCTPRRALELIKRIPYSKIVFAHMGGCELFDEVYDTLCGQNVYFDTAYVLRFIGSDTFKKMLEKHGDDKILFASDSPWSDPSADVALLKSFGLDKSTERKLLYENAARLLKIKD